jgi:hypothetical protein
MALAFRNTAPSVRKSQTQIFVLSLNSFSYQIDNCMYMYSMKPCECRCLLLRNQRIFEEKGFGSNTLGLQNSPLSERLWTMAPLNIPDSAVFEAIFIVMILLEQNIYPSLM